MPGQPLTPTSSSNAFISGEPAVLGFLSNELDSFPDMLNAVFEAALQEEQDRVQRAYIDRGIPAEVSVSYDHESMEVIYFASGEGVSEAEYGGPESRPQAILRKAAIKGGKTLVKTLEKKAR